MKKRGIWISFWLYNIFIIQGAVMPEGMVRFFERFNDKMVHGVEYFLLFWFAWAAFRHARASFLNSRAMPNAFYYCLLMGILTEGLQFLTPSRSPDFKDVAADAMGAGNALVTRQRQREAIGDAVSALAVARGVPPEIKADLLRAASEAIGRLSGRVDVEDVLDRLFREFCIGK